VPRHRSLASLDTIISYDYDEDQQNEIKEGHNTKNFNTANVVSTGHLAENSDEFQQECNDDDKFRNHVNAIVKQNQVRAFAYIRQHHLADAATSKTQLTFFLFQILTFLFTFTLFQYHKSQCFILLAFLMIDTNNTLFSLSKSIMPMQNIHIRL